MRSSSRMGVDDFELAGSSQPLRYSPLRTRQPHFPVSSHSASCLVTVLCGATARAAPGPQRAQSTTNLMSRAVQTAPTNSAALRAAHAAGLIVMRAARMAHE